MEWTLRLVGTETDGQPRSCEVMAISRPDDLGDIAALGLTLAEAKQLLVQVQQEVVAPQARQHTLFRPDWAGALARGKLALEIVRERLRLRASGLPRHDSS